MSAIVRDIIVQGVDVGALRLISPHIRVRLESAPAGFAVHASPVVDDASRATVHTLFHPSPYPRYPRPYTLVSRYGMR